LTAVVVILGVKCATGWRAGGCEVAAASDVPMEQVAAFIETIYDLL
jgi:hypothetical protein